MFPAQYRDLNPLLVFDSDGSLHVQDTVENLRVMSDFFVWLATMESPPDICENVLGPGWSHVHRMVDAALAQVSQVVRKGGES